MSTKIKEIIKIIEDIDQAKIAIAITGSVASGKTTFSKQIKDELLKLNKSVEIVSTDNFIKSNDQLIKENIFNQKGFPNSYNLLALEEVIINWKKGMTQTIPCYEQAIADISFDKQLQISNSDVLIIEGVTSLRIKKDLIDLSIFLEAKLESIKDWYLQRTLNFIDNADEKNWYFSYKALSDSEKVTKIMSVWDDVNYVNYLNYIEPLKQNVDLIVKKDEKHNIIDIKKNN